MRVVLVYPNQSMLEEPNRRFRYLGLNSRPNPHLPLGILSLCSNIRGHEIAYIDNNIEKKNNQDLIGSIEAHNPDLVGFGGTMTEWPQARHVSSRLREQGVKTVYGGSNATVNPRKHIRHFDFVIRGEGETPLQQLLDQLEAGSEVSAEGVCYLDGQNEYVVSQFFETDLDSLNLPDRDIAQIGRYRRDMNPFPLPQPVDIVMSTRGCPYNCRFCSSQFIWGRRYKKRSVDSVLAEIALMKQKYGSRSIHFREDHFTIDKNRLQKMCEGLKSIGIPWMCQTRIDDINEELLLLMKESGCRGVNCGFESANDSTLNYINKGFRFEDVERSIRLLSKIGISWSGGFMVGVLNEGEEEIAKTLEYVKHIRSLPGSKQPRGAMRFLGFPISETYLEMKEKGLVAYDWQEGEMLIPRTYKLTATEVEKAIQRYW